MEKGLEKLNNIGGFFLKSLKTCPYCGEEININAKKCKYCKKWLEKTEPKTRICPFCKEEINYTAQKCKYCGEWLKYNTSEEIICKISNYQKTSNILWLIIAILQICSVICIIAGIWNIIATISTWEFPKKILNKDDDIPSLYDSITGYIIIGLINFFIGGILGIVLLGFDLYIRDLILKNKYLFINETHKNVLSKEGY